MLYATCSYINHYRNRALCTEAVKFSLRGSSKQHCKHRWKYVCLVELLQVCKTFVLRNTVFLHVLCVKEKVSKLEALKY